MNSGERIKEYRKMLKISQKQAANGRLSHSMISLIESGKIQLTTVTAIILADNLNKIAAERGINLNLSLKDMIMSKEEYIEENCKKKLDDLMRIDFNIDKYEDIFIIAEEHNLFSLMAYTKELIGDYYSSNEKYELALIAYEISCDCYNRVNMCVEHARALYKSGICYIKLKKYSECDSHLKKAISVLQFTEPLDIGFYLKVLYEISMLKYTCGNYEEALYYINISTAIPQMDKAKTSDILGLKANIYLKQKKYEDSVQVFNEILQSDFEEKHIILFSLSIAFSKLQMKDKSQYYYDEALIFMLSRNTPSNTINLLNAGQAYKEFEIFDKALVCFEKALEYANNHSQDKLRIICYKKIQGIYSDQKRLFDFGNYAKQIEEYINTKHNDKFKLHYVMIIVKYYLSINMPKKIEEIITNLEDEDIYI
jgi:tetratricopeptide (TPR) repeat protein